MRRSYRRTPLSTLAGLLALLAFLALAPSAAAAAPICRTVDLGTITHTAEPVMGSPDCTGAFSSVQVTQPAQGTVRTVFGTSFEYEPNGTYVGKDQFTYSVTGIGGTSVPKTVTVTVTNDPPDCASDVVRIRQDKQASVLAPCFDTDALTLEVLQMPQGQLEVQGAELLYTAGPGFRGYDSLRARASDGVAWSAPFELTILVTRNHAPRCDPETVHTRIGQPADVFVASACMDPDLQDQDLAIAVKPGTGPAPGNAISELNEGQLTYTPGGSFTGADRFDITASDGALTTTATQRLHVADTAFCSPEPTVQLRPGTSHEFDADCTLPPGVTGAMDLAVVQQGSKGTVTKTAQGFRYTANAGATGADSFSFKAGAEGAFGPAAVQTIAIDAAANRAPGCDDPPGAQIVYAGRTQTLIPPCTDPDSDPLTYQAAGTPPHGTLVAENGLLRYSANAGHVGFDIVSYRATDGRSAAQGPFEYPVEARAPEIPECFPLAALQLRPQRSVTFMTNCTNPQGDPQTYEIVSGPTKGTLVQTGVPGQFTYRSGSVSGDDSFQIRARNPVGPSAPVIIGAQINDNFNSAPVCTSPAVPLKVARGTTTPLPLAGRCTDVDEDELTFTLRDRPENGTVTPTGPAASLSYVAGQQLGPEVFSFVATDRRGAESQATSFEIEVVDSLTPNRAPVCVGGSLDVDAGASETVPTTCTDPDGDALTLQVVTAPQSGDLTPGPTGLAYEPTGCGQQDSFTIQATDGSLESAVVRFDVQVHPVAGPRGVVVSQASNAAIEGATVRLQRHDGAQWRDVDAADPCVAAAANPQTTGGDGRFGWDVYGGTFRVTVTKSSDYVPMTSPERSFPPSGDEIRVSLAAADTGAPPDSGGGTTSGGGSATGGGTTTGGGTPVAPPDDQPPSLQAAPTGTTKLARVRTGGLRVRFSCGESCTASFELLLDKRTARKLKVHASAKSAVRIGSATASATAATVVVKLTARARKALKSARSVKVTLQGSASDAAGNVCLLKPKVLTLKK